MIKHTEKIFLEKLKDGPEPTIILINGFLSVRADYNRWVKNLPPSMQKNQILGLRWPAQDYLDLGIRSIKKSAEKFISPEDEAMDPRIAIVNQDFPKGLMEILMVSEFVLATYEAWEISLKEAQKTGQWLGDYIANSESNYTLMGFSLGTEIINLALTELAHQKKGQVKDVFLLGGTARSYRTRTDRDHAGQWDKALNAIKGKIYNFYSYNDTVLSSLFIKALQVSQSMSKEISPYERELAKEDLEKYRTYAKLSPSYEFTLPFLENGDISLKILSTRLQRLIPQLVRLGLDIEHIWTEKDFEEYNYNLAEYINKYPRLDTSLPIGLPPGIRTQNKEESRIKNINASDIISNHLQYREYLDLLIERAFYLCGDITA